MGFLDNSGDIILDAVLTDIGRMKMADGNFRIVKFALGDDEIDYSLFNPTHPSGTAYYDLEILQSPVMEAATKQASSIKYGLRSITSNDILYMPILVQNEKPAANAVSKVNNVLLLAANTLTYTTLVADTLVGSSKVLPPNTTTPQSTVVIESGIESNQRQPTLDNRNTMLVTTGLLDMAYDVRFDNRFVSETISVQNEPGQKFANNINGSRNIDFSSFAGVPVSSATQFLDNYATSVVSGIENLVLQHDTAAGASATGSDLSALAGPRGGVTALTFSPTAEINAQGTASPSFYTLYGKTGVDGATIGLTTGTNYDYIDTTIYVQGRSSGASLQLPVRIIRQQA